MFNLTAAVIILGLISNASLSCEKETVAFFRPSLFDELNREYSVLKEKFKNQDSVSVDLSRELRRMELSSDHIQQPREDIRNEGRQSAGIFTVETKEGIKVLKVIQKPRQKNQMNFAFLQQSIARMRKGPALRGLLNHSSCMELKRKFSKKFSDFLDNPNPIEYIGVFMDEVPNGWNMKSPRSPAWLKTLDKDRILKQLDEIGLLFSVLSISDADGVPQVLITPEGGVSIIDFDALWWTPRFSDNPQELTEHGQEIAKQLKDDFLAHFQKH